MQGHRFLFVLLPGGVEGLLGVEALPGRGLRAVLDGHTVLAGSEALLEEAGAALPPTARAEAEGFQAQGCTLIYLAVDGAPAGFCALADTVRGEAAAMLCGGGLVIAIRILSAHFRWNLPHAHD